MREYGHVQTHLQVISRNARGIMKIISRLLCYVKMIVFRVLGLGQSSSYMHMPNDECCLSELEHGHVLSSSRDVETCNRFSDYMLEFDQSHATAGNLVPDLDRPVAPTGPDGVHCPYPKHWPRCEFCARPAQNTPCPTCDIRLCTRCQRRGVGCGCVHVGPLPALAVFGVNDTRSTIPIPGFLVVRSSSACGQGPVATGQQYAVDSEASALDYKRFICSADHYAGDGKDDHELAPSTTLPAIANADPPVGPGTPALEHPADKSAVDAPPPPPAETVKGAELLLAVQEITGPTGENDVRALSVPKFESPDSDSRTAIHNTGEKSSEELESASKAGSAVSTNTSRKTKAERAAARKAVIAAQAAAEQKALETQVKLAQVNLDYLEDIMEEQPASAGTKRVSEDSGQPPHKRRDSSVERGASQAPAASSAVNPSDGRVASLNEHTLNQHELAQAAVGKDSSKPSDLPSTTTPHTQPSTNQPDTSVGEVDSVHTDVGRGLPSGKRNDSSVGDQLLCHKASMPHRAQRASADLPNGPPLPGSPRHASAGVPLLPASKSNSCYGPSRRPPSQERSRQSEAPYNDGSAANRASQSSDTNRSKVSDRDFAKWLDQVLQTEIASTSGSSLDKNVSSYVDVLQRCRSDISSIKRKATEVDSSVDKRPLTVPRTEGEASSSDTRVELNMSQLRINDLQQQLEVLKSASEETFRAYQTSVTLLEQQKSQETEAARSEVLNRAILEYQNSLRAMESQCAQELSQYKHALVDQSAHHDQLAKAFDAERLRADTAEQNAARRQALADKAENDKLALQQENDLAVRSLKSTRDHHIHEAHEQVWNLQRLQDEQKRDFEARLLAEQQLRESAQDERSLALRQLSDVQAKASDDNARVLAEYAKTITEINVLKQQVVEISKASSKPASEASHRSKASERTQALEAENARLKEALAESTESIKDLKQQKVASARRSNAEAASSSSDVQRAFIGTPSGTDREVYEEWGGLEEVGSGLDQSLATQPFYTNAMDAASANSVRHGGRFLQTVPPLLGATYGRDSPFFDTLEPLNNRC